MLKLFTANAVQVLRNKAFWACLAFTVIGTAILVVSTFNMLDYNGLVNLWTAEASLFCMLPGIGIINAIFIHLTIGTDYDQGTIRSKPDPEFGALLASLPRHLAHSGRVGAAHA